MDELEIVEIDNEVDIESKDEDLENLPKKPQNHLEEENYEIGDEDI